MQYVRAGGWMVRLGPQGMSAFTFRARELAQALCDPFMQVQVKRCQEVEDDILLSYKNMESKPIDSRKLSYGDKFV